MARSVRRRKAPPGAALIRRVRRVVGRFIAVVLFTALGWIGAYALINPPVTAYMVSEHWRLGERLHRTWVPIDDISVHLQRAVVAAEDANFCTHWGFDMDAIRAAIAAGGARGGSTITQQTVKNAFLWHERSYARKAIEALITPVVEAIWSKRRILEVYLNIAEFDAGVFGAEAAAQHYFGVTAADLTLAQAARLAALLPDPQGRDAATPSDFVRRRAESIAAGARTIRADGRDDCFAR